jgi:hypothetical protein
MQYVQCSTVLEKLLVIQLLMKFPAFYGIQMSITVFTMAKNGLYSSQMNSVHTPILFLLDRF